MSEKLKPCPWCGDATSFVERADYSSCYVHCNGCGAHGPIGEDMTADNSEEVPGYAQAAELWNRRAPESASQPGGAEAVKVDAVRGNFTPFYIMVNVRRIVPAYYNKQRANWVLAMDVFAVGSRSAYHICEEAGIDPDGFTVERAAPSAGNGGAEGDAAPTTGHSHEHP